MKIQKKIIFKIFIIFIVFFIIRSPCVVASQEEILQSQSENLNIKGFVSEANKYTKDVFSGLDVNDLMNEAIRGNVNNKTIFSKILNLFGKEIGETLKIIRKYYCSYCNT